MIIGTEGSKITIQSKPTVQVVGAVTLSCDDQEIASVDATYDFSNVPGHLHGLALNVIVQKQTNLCIPYYMLPSNHSVRKHIESHINKKKFGFGI